MSTSKDTTSNSKKSSGNEKSGDRMPPAFIKYRLSEEELAQAKNAAAEYSDVGEIIEGFIAEGYKFSCSHDNWGGGTQVFITPQTGDNRNVGFTLSARGPELIPAVAVLCWKHYTLFGQEWPKEQGEARGSNWG